MKTRNLFFAAIMTVALGNAPKLKSETETLYVTAKSGLAMYEKPDSKSRKITTVPFKEKVDVIFQEDLTGRADIIDGRPGAWLRISYRKKEGYAFTGYLSEVEPDEKNPLVGEYIMKVASLEGLPSRMILYGDGTFVYTVNMCQGFGLLFGKYTARGNTARLKIDRADFTLAREDRIELVFAVEKDALCLKNLVPARKIGCDFKVNTMFIKK